MPVADFFLKRDDALAASVFEKHINKETTLLPLDNLEKALAEFGTSSKDLDNDELEALLKTMGVSGAKELPEGAPPQELSLDNFKHILRRASHLDRWATSLPLGNLLAHCISEVEGTDQDALRMLSSLSDANIDKVGAMFVEGLKRVVKDESKRLQRAFTTMDTKAKAEEAGTVSKYSTFKMSCGNIVDFHKGLSGRIGIPHLDFFKKMEAEHCRLAGHDIEFTTGNYHITTTPHKEWDIATGVREPDKVDMKHDRVIRTIEVLRSQPLASTAALTDAELLALSLYTGPLFQVYNCILRRYPGPRYQVFEDGANLYPTTIHVLVSAVQKIARVMQLPEGLLLYCGLGGLMELPDTFWTADEFGCRGYVEWGFRSTTSSKAVAIQYSGVAQGKPLAMVLEIAVGSVDRGACIRDFSQYPAEVEYLWVPCSYLEPLGERKLEVTQHGVVTVIPIRMNANLHASTIEELLGQKKSMHLSAFRFLVDEVKQALEEMATGERAAERWKKEKEAYSPNAADEMLTTKDFVDLIMGQVRAVYTKHEETTAERYTNDELFQTLVIAMLETKKHALAKFQWWLEDDTQSIMAQGSKSWASMSNNAESLEGAYLGWLAFLRNKLSVLPVGSEEHIATALRLCKLEGLVSENIDEVNDKGEPPFFAASEHGATLETLQLLKFAGADVDARAGKLTALFCACRRGDAPRVRELGSLGANLDLPCNGVIVPCLVAAEGKHLNVLTAMVEMGANINGGPRFFRGSPNVFNTAQKSGDEEFFAAVKALGATK